MKRSVTLLGILMLVSAAVLYFFVFKGEKEEKKITGNGIDSPANIISHRSEAFNKSVDNMLNSYYEMTEGFVNWDTAVVRNNSKDFQNALDSLGMEELKNDSAIYSSAVKLWDAAKAEAAAIAGDNNLDEQRASLNLLSQAMFELLNKIQFDKSKVYYQECPMAFNDINTGNWLSPVPAIRNPFLGTSHPKYHAGMLKCGSTKDSISFATK